LPVDDAWKSSFIAPLPVVAPFGGWGSTGKSWDFPTFSVEKI
jgi:hypothetical protein